MRAHFRFCVRSISCVHLLVLLLSSQTQISWRLLGWRELKTAQRELIRTHTHTHTEAPLGWYVLCVLRNSLCPSSLAVFPFWAIFQTPPQHTPNPSPVCYFSYPSRLL